MVSIFQIQYLCISISFNWLIIKLNTASAQRSSDTLNPLRVRRHSGVHRGLFQSTSFTLTNNSQTKQASTIGWLIEKRTARIVLTWVPIHTAESAQLSGRNIPFPRVASCAVSICWNCQCDQLKSSTTFTTKRCSAIAGGLNVAIDKIKGPVIEGYKMGVHLGVLNSHVKY